MQKLILQPNAMAYNIKHVQTNQISLSSIANIKYLIFHGFFPVKCEITRQNMCTMQG